MDVTKNSYYTYLGVRYRKKTKNIYYACDSKQGDKLLISKGLVSTKWSEKETLGWREDNKKAGFKGERDGDDWVCIYIHDVRLWQERKKPEDNSLSEKC